ncbi:MAG: hypothetical protein ACR2FX_06210 [Chthoniobacterales bacterium]
MYREVRSVGAWLRHGWYIIPAYVISFFVMLKVHPWHPDPPRRSAIYGGRDALSKRSALP